MERERHALELTERRVPSEERAAELDRKLRGLHRGMRVSIGYYANQEYWSVSGTVQQIEPIEGFLKVGGQRIPFTDIWDIFPDQPLPFPGE